MKEIIVFSEALDLLRELICAGNILAKELNAKVSAICLGSRSEAESLQHYDVSKIYWLGMVQDHKLVEDYIPTLLSIIKQSTPLGLLIGATKRGKAIAGRLAAKLNTSVITDVRNFLFVNGDLQVCHLIYGGGAIRTEQPPLSTAIMTIGQGVFAPQPDFPGPKIKLIEVPFIEPKWRMILQERQLKSSAQVNISAAKRVVCPGRGVAKKEDLVMIEELANLLGAEIGCTRPLTEGVNWLSREHYIGVSGKYIKPDLYVGIGVSGQVQHTIGISDAKIIVGINKDQSAPIFDQADFGIVGDLYQIVPLLIQALKDRSN